MEIKWAVIPLLTIVLIQWVIFVGLHLFWRKRDRIDWKLLASTAVLAIVWFVAFDPRSAVAKTEAPKVVQASTVVTPAAPVRFTCASIDEGMSAMQVREKLGRPDEEVSEEDTRGPGAKKWVYRATRCSIHLFDDRVEFIE